MSPSQKMQKLSQNAFGCTSTLWSLSQATPYACFLTNDSRGSASARPPTAHICLHCESCIHRIFNRETTPAFSLFRPITETCWLCSFVAQAQAAPWTSQDRVKYLLRCQIQSPGVSKLKSYEFFSSWLKPHHGFITSKYRLSPELFNDHRWLVPFKNDSNQDTEHNRARAAKLARADPEAIAAWLRKCECSHSETCTITSYQQSLLASTQHHPEHELYLVEVGRNRLVRAPQSTRFVALSYVWGDGNHFRLSKADIPRYLEQDGLPVASFPRTIRDATELTRSIGVEFLWVDSVCIPQDDSVEKGLQISRMSSVYSSAVLTLVAVSATSASDPLPRVQECGRDTIVVAYQDPDFCLAVRKPASNLSRTLTASYYNSRAWTFQERLLSLRCLYFTDEQVFFQCQRSTFCEDYDGDIENLRDWSFLNPLSPRLTQTDPPLNKEQRFRIYTKIVQEYTNKTLSFPADIHSAFAGLSAVLENLLFSRFYFGLPEHYIVEALMWTFDPGQKRREVVVVEDAMSAAFHNAGEASDIFPSWSWSSRVGIVSHTVTGGFRPLVRECYIDEPSHDRYAPTHCHSGCLRLVTCVDRGSLFSFGPLLLLQGFLSILNKDKEGCGRIRLDDGPMSWDCELTQGAVSLGLVGLCDSEKAFLGEDFTGEKGLGSSLTRPMYPRIYYDSSPWTMSIVLLVQWKGDAARRLGIGEIRSDEWTKTQNCEEMVHLI